MNWKKYAGCHHFELDGKTFDLRDGLPFQGANIFPGQSADCSCSYTSVVDGFVDKDPYEVFKEKRARTRASNHAWIWAILAASAITIYCLLK